MKPESAAREQNPPSSRASPASPLSLPFQRSPRQYSWIQGDNGPAPSSPSLHLQQFARNRELLPEESTRANIYRQHCSLCQAWALGHLHKAPPPTRYLLAYGGTWGGPGAPAASEGCHLGSPEPPAPPRQMWPAGPVRSYPTAVPHLAALEAPLFGKGWHCHSSSPVLQGGTAELSTARRSHSELVTTGLGENTALPGLRQGREPAEMLALPLPLQNHRRWCL